MDFTLVLKNLHLFFGNFIFVYMLIIVFVYSTMFFFAFLDIFKKKKINRVLENDGNLKSLYSKPVSVLVPAHNEEVGVVSTVQSLLTLEYPKYEIIIINDGSTDRTLEVLIDAFSMKEVFRTVRMQLDCQKLKRIYQSTTHSNIVLIDKVQGGKADALNAGINISQYPYFCSIDGDSILTSKSLLQVMNPIISSDNEVIATGGSVRIANGADIQFGTVMKMTLPKKPLVIMQVIEYMRAFYIGRIALNSFNLILIISGAFSVFSREYVIKVGGYSTKTVGEDMELVVRMHQYILKNKLNKKIAFTPDPVCWTEAPSNIEDLYKQRKRWHLGLVSSIWLNRGMAFNPRYKQIGLISFPYFIFIELIGPIIELLGYIYMIITFLVGSINILSAIVLLLLFLIYSSVLSMFGVLFEAWSTNTYPRSKDSLKLLLYSLTEVFWFRPMIAYFRLIGLFSFIFGKSEWGELKRIGLTKRKDKMAVQNIK